MKDFSSKVVKFLDSELFFRLIIVLLVVEAAWIAIGARYPQAFDEQFHFGLIQLHAQHLWPLLTSEPAGTESLGAYTRDPSFLYHYLFSFPYRLLMHMTSSFTLQIVTLRLINVALFASALPLMRKVLRYSSASRAMIHTCLFFFVVIPVVPILAAEINYDNLLIVLSSLAFLWCLRFRAAKQFDLRLAIQLVILGIFTSMVKYAFLPIFAAICLYILYRAVRRTPQGLLKDIRALPHRLLLIYGILILLGGGFFVERYGMNILHYHTPIPECNQVLSIERCQEYGPWARNYQLTNLHEKLSTAQTIGYPYQWLCRMMQEMIFVISSGFNGAGTVDYWPFDSLPNAKILAWTVLCAGAIAVIWSVRALRKEPVLWALLLLGGSYTAALFLQNYQDFIHTHHVVAVHGRYLLPFTPMLLLAIMLAFRHVFNTKQLAQFTDGSFKVLLTIVVAFLFVTQGGSDVNYIVRSESRWFWPQNHTIQRINADAKRALEVVVIGD